MTPDKDPITVEQHRALARFLGLAVASSVGLSALVIGVPAVLPGSSPTASAADGDAQPLLTDKTTPQATAQPGQVIQYAINYTCSNDNPTPPVDDCNSALFSDPLPKFTNIYGELQPLEFIDVSAPATEWPTGLRLDTTDPANPRIVGTAGNGADGGSWPAGVAGAIFVNMRVPLGVVPAAPQPVSNTATVIDPVAPPDSSTTAVTTISATAPAWVVGKLGPATSRLDRDATWTVSVCGPSTSALFPLYTVTDTLAPGTQFVSGTLGATYTDDNILPAPADVVSDGAGVVTWNFSAINRPPLTSDGCFRMAVTGRFPTGYVDPTPVNPANDNNVGNAVKTDVATAVGRQLPADPGVGLGTAPWSTTLSTPAFGIGTGGHSKVFSDTSGGDNFYALIGDVTVFTLAASIDSDLPADRFTVTDGTSTFYSGSGPNPTSGGSGLPTSFRPTTLDPGTWNASLTATIEGSNDGFATSAVVASGIASNAADIVLGTPYRSFRWTWGGTANSVPGNFAASGMRIIGTLGTGAPSSALGLYTNTSTMVAVRGIDTITASASDQYILEAPLPHPAIDKSVAVDNRQPGQTDVYTIVVSNSPDATGPLVNPFIEDCVPAYFAVQGAPALGTGWATGAPLPSCAVGQTPLRFNYTGTLTPGQATSAVTYTILVAPNTPGPIAPPGVYTNTAFVRPFGGGSFGHCVNTSPSCGDSAVVTVTPTVTLASQKCVSGDLDSSIFRPSPACQTDPGGAVVAAQTLPGGVMTWELRLRNTGNTAATSIDFIDIFPKVGDTSVITETANPFDGTTLNTRNSEFAPYLVSPITAPAGWTVSYSTTANPCRPEVGRNVSCGAPAWVTNPSFALLPTFQSVKFSFAGTLAMGGTATFAWTTRAPVFDTTFDRGGTSATNPYEFLEVCQAQAAPSNSLHCPRAVNSFAYGANATNLPPGVPAPSRLFAEPPAVEVRVIAPPKPNGIGNRVWLDRNFDGRQGADTSPTGEPGLPGVYVELYQANILVPGSYVLAGFTYTDVSGNYLFSGGAAGLPDGTYKVRFYPQAGYYVSPRDVTGAATDQGAPDPGVNPGTNTDDDSDVSRTSSGANGFGAFYETTDVVLGNNDNTNVGSPSQGELDRTWDLGLWFPQPAIDVVKVTKDTAWPDAAAGDGVGIIQGRGVTWIYTVTNTGNTRLQNVTLSDDGGPNPTFSVTNCSITAPGTNADGLLSSATAPFALNRGATMRCTATGTAGRVNYANVATVTGTPRQDNGGVLAAPGLPATVTDTDPSSYVAGKYDLALAKTATINLTNGTAAFTITVLNEGSVASGLYSVTDVLPAGMAFASAVPAPTTITGGTLVWTNLTSLASGASRTITVNTTVTSYLVRPYRNYAEVSADSSALVATGGVATPTTDSDSTPDADITNDNTGNGVAAGNGYGPVGTPDATVDNANITQAGSRLFPNTGDDANDGQDDADIADLAPVITYDLALAKVSSNSPIGLATNPTFQVRVHNQGNVPSGTVVVRDRIPTGLTFTATGSTAGCTAAGSLVTCNVATIAPGASTLLTLVTTVNGAPRNFSTAPWRNWAEISSDSGQTLYAVSDGDSVPESIQLNGIGADGTLPGDPYVGIATAGTTYATPTGADEDDNDDGVATTSVVYDLALIKTITSVDLDSGLITYAITIRNQGTVASGVYSVTDWLPIGLAVNGTPAPAPTTTTGSSVIGTRLTWTGLPTLAAGASQTIVLVARIADYTRRPFRNLAEISADSAQSLYVINDVDSVPDTITTNDGTYGAIGASTIDNLVIGDAGVLGGDPQDDADIGDVNPVITYDLALAKVASNAPVGLGTAPIFQVRVYNQGTVPSGAVVVRDRIPSGLTFDPAGSTSGCVDSGSSIVTCTLTTISAGTSRLLTLATTIDGTPDNLSTAPWRNWAEIYSDSAQSIYGIDDVDSQPEISQANGVGANSTLPGDAYVGVTTAGATYVAPIGTDEDDNDDAITASSVRYDLALVKTVANVDIVTGAMDFTITVQNQGNVPSGVFTVTDVLPTGLALDGTPVPAATTVTGSSLTSTTITWTDLPGLAPGASTTVTFSARIVDYARRPFRNIAEISDDSALELYVLNDADSVPDTVTTNDGTYGAIGASPIDGFVIGDAGVRGGDPQDDADVADVAPTIVYDLALAKVAVDDTIDLGEAPAFQVRVYNQGNVSSGPVVVTDRIPTGLTFTPTGSSAGCVDLGFNVVSCTVASVAPGASTLVTLATTINGTPDNFSTAPWRNWAEIYSDSAQSMYGIDDADSRPEISQANGVGNDGTLPGDGYTGVTTAGPAYAAPLGIDEDDNDDASAATSVRYDLALVKTVANIDIANGTFDYTITIANQGNVASGVFTVTDRLPAGLAMSAGAAPAVTSTTGSSLIGTTLTWSGLANLAPGGSTTITFSVNVVDYRLQPFRNIAEISADSAVALYGIADIDSTPDTIATNDGTYGPVGASAIDNLVIGDAGVRGGDPQDDADIADAVLAVDYDLALAKVADATLISQSDTITYTISVQNQGNVHSGPFVVTDTVPAGLAFAGSPDGGTFVDASPDLVTFSVADLSPGGVRSFRWTATVADLTQRPYRNVAEISSDSAQALYALDDTDSTPDANASNDGSYGPVGTPSAIDSLTLADAGVRGGDPEDDADIADVDIDNLSYDLALAKTVDGATTTYDGTITYTITVQNQGNLASRQVQVTDWIPDGVQIVGLDGAVDNNDGTVTWTIADIAPGASLTRTLTVRVSDVTKRPFRNIAEISADSADYYDVTVGNVIDVEDDDSTPDLDRTDDGLYGPVLAAGPIDNLDPNAIGGAGAGADTEDDADIADVDVPVLYDLAMVKVGPATITPAGTATFTISIANQGNVPSGPYSVTDHLPAGLEAIAASNGGDLSAPTTQVVWTNLPSLAPGATTAVTVEVRVVDLDRRPFTNVAEITADSATAYRAPAVPDGPGRPATPAVDVTDDDSSPNADPDDDVVVDQTSLPIGQHNDPLADEDDHDVAVLDVDVVYDLALVKTVAAPTIAFDGIATFTITVVNQGNVPSGVYTVTDSLPPGTTLVSASDGGLANGATTMVSWDLPSLAVGESRSLTLVLRPTDLTRAPYRNVADISADSSSAYSTLADPVADADSVPGDPATSAADNLAVADAGVGGDTGFDDEDVAIVAVPVVYDLALVKNVVPGQNYRQGSVIAYEIQVKNQGNVPSNRYSVQDVIPAGMTFVAAAGGGSFVAGTVFWTDLPSLAPGQVVTLAVQLRLDVVTLTQYRNVAEITRDGSAQYSTSTVAASDEDSRPDDNPNNDPVIDVSNVNVDTTPGDEDDHDVAVLDTALVAGDNSSPTPTPTLPVTGAQLATLLLAALASLGSGMLLSSRRPRRRSATPAS